MDGCFLCLGMCTFQPYIIIIIVCLCAHVHSACIYVEYRWMCHSLLNPVTPLYSFHTVPGSCRANLLLGNQTQPIWGNCTLQSLLFLAPGSDQGPQTAVMAFREGVTHTAALKLSCKLRVFGRHQGLCEPSQVIVFLHVYFLCIQV